MDKNGQKYTSNLQMSVFAITDDRKALRSIFRIFILYAGRDPLTNNAHVTDVTKDVFENLNRD